jgi:hypothetical protein
MLGPGDGVVELLPGTALRTQHHASGFLGTGWGATYEGAIDARSITADELIVQTFIADAARVRVGSLWVTPGAALLAETFVVPAVGATRTMVVEDAPTQGLANLPVFDEGDWVMIRVLDRSGGGLRAGLAWGQVTGYADGPGVGQQSWTFTCRQTLTPGATAAGGDEVLGFAKSGAGWIQATTTDATGAPWLGMTTWRGDNPYTDGNRVHFLRIGQLRGVTGVWEQGFWVGQGGARRLKFSELGPEIHGARMSLYAGDGAQARVVAAEVRLYRDGSNYSTLTPNGDGVATNVLSSGIGYYGQIDDAVDAPNAADWVANGLNSSGQVSVQLTDPAVWGAIYSVTVRAVVAGVGFSSDSVRVYGQVVGADEVTPLTGEELLATLASNVTTTVTKTMRADAAATQTQWNGARLRLRWDYSINSAKEAIRLDPQIPSIAVGMGLPMGTASGGAGFWAGAEGGEYKARIGDPAGARLVYDGNAVRLFSGLTGMAIALDPAAQSIALGSPLPTGTQSGGPGFWVGSLGGGAYGLRIGGAYLGGPQLLYDGTSGALSFRRTNGEAVITLAGNGDAYLAGVVTLGAAGALFQGVGLPTAPTSGLRIWRDGNVGRLATYSGGVEQVGFDTTGRLSAGAGAIKLDAAGLHVYHLASGGEVLRMRGQGVEFIDTDAFTDSRGIRFFHNAEEYGNVQGLFSTATGERAVRLQAVPVSSTSPARALVQALSGSKGASVNAFANSAGSSLTLAAERVIVTAPIQVGSVRFLPMATKPTVPAGYVELYAYQNGANAQVILRNRLGTEVVLGTVLL